MNYTPVTFEKSMSMINEHLGTALKQLPEAQALLHEKFETDIAITPYTVIHEEERVKLKHYQSPVPSKFKTPLFIVYALINRETMLDLQPDRSVIRQMLNSGIDLYVLDWGYPTRKDRYLNIDDHVNTFISNAVDVILKRTGVDKLNLMGVCMGGTFCAIYSALHPEKVRNLILTVAPTSFDHNEGLLHTWWGNNDFNVDQFIDMCGNVPGDYLNAHFLLLNPAKLVIDKYIGFLKNLDKKDVVQNFIRMEKWIFDSPDVPGETFREFINFFYKENRFIKNTLEIGGQHIDLNAITMPVLNIYGKFDHLVPPAACDQFIHHVASKDVQDLCLDTGHIGIYVSSKTQKVFTPTIVSWLRDRDGEQEETVRFQRTDQRRTRMIAPDNRRANTLRYRRA